MTAFSFAFLCEQFQNEQTRVRWHTHTQLPEGESAGRLSARLRVVCASARVARASLHARSNGALPALRRRRVVRGPRGLHETHRAARVAGVKLLRWW